MKTLKILGFALVALAVLGGVATAEPDIASMFKAVGTYDVADDLWVFTLQNLTPVEDGIVPIEFELFWTDSEGFELPASSQGYAGVFAVAPNWGMVGELQDPSVAPSWSNNTNTYDYLNPPQFKIRCTTAPNMFYVSTYNMVSSDYGPDGEAPTDLPGGAVPEPSSIVALISGLALAVSRTRRIL